MLLLVLSVQKCCVRRHYGRGHHLRPTCNFLLGRCRWGKGPFGDTNFTALEKTHYNFITRSSDTSMLRKLWRNTSHFVHGDYTHSLWSLTPLLAHFISHNHPKLPPLGTASLVDALLWRRPPSRLATTVLIGPLEQRRPLIGSEVSGTQPSEMSTNKIFLHVTCRHTFILACKYTLVYT